MDKDSIQEKVRKGLAYRQKKLKILINNRVRKQIPFLELQKQLAEYEEFLEKSNCNI